MQRQRKPMADRFWPKVDTSGDCWVWTGSRDTSGYGQIRDPIGRLRRATHIAWGMAHGVIPEGAMLCHTCDNRACVRPEHLFLGNATDNAADMVKKGRSAKGDASTSRLYPELRQRGIDHPKSKLDDAKVREIRERSAHGETQRALAQAFGVGKTAIQGIVEGKTWRHVR